MKHINTTIWQASLMSGLSQIQLWILIQNRIVKPTISDQEVKINIYKLRELTMRNNRAMYQLQLPVDQRDIRFSLKDCIKTWKKENKKK